MDRITPEKIENLKDNEIFVFGSNTEGRHGKGAALTARTKFRAIYGQSKGLQGQSYAIITKDLSKGYRSVRIDFIKEQVEEFIEFALNNKHLTFYVTEIGCNLGGFKHSEIAPLFKKAIDVENIYLPQKFIENGK